MENIDQFQDRALEIGRVIRIDNRFSKRFPR